MLKAYLCFTICEEIGMMWESAAIHLMKTSDMTSHGAFLKTTMGKDVYRGMTVMVLLALRRALTIIMVC